VVQEVRDWEGRTPCSNESWWKQISRWLDWRRLTLGVCSALALAVITGLLVWFFGPTMEDPQLAEFQGNGVSVERGTEFIPASVELRLQPADILRTGTNETATLTFGRKRTRLNLHPGTELPADILRRWTNETASVTFGRERTRIYLHPGTELKLNEMSRGKRFALRIGRIEASVARQRPFRAMVVVTPQAEARVLGTKFTLDVTTNSTRLEVTEGKVRLTRASDGKAVKVTAGYHTVAAANYELAALPQTGRILYEYWTNFPDINTFWWENISKDPSVVEYPARFEAPSHAGSNFLARIRGYVHPPKTGDYTFWIAGDNSCQFLLSPDDQPENKVSIATANNTKPREWTDEIQQSSSITLIAGQKYYIEAVEQYFTEAFPNDGEHHLAVAWQGPDRQREVIPGEFLSPFETKTKEKKR